LSEFPLIGTAALRQVQPGGGGALATATVARILADRAEFLSQTRGRIAAMWAINESPNGYPISGYNRPTVIADLLLPPVAHLGKPQIHIKVGNRTIGRVKVYTQVLVPLNGDAPVPQGSPILNGDFGSNGWYTQELDQWAFYYRSNITRPTLLRVSIAQVDGFNGSVESVCVSCATDFYAMPDGTLSPSDIAKTSILHAGGVNRPYDVVTLSRVRDAQNTIAQRYSRVLATHSFAANSATSGAVRASYNFFRGVTDGACTLAVRCKQNNAGGAGAAGTLSVEIYGTPFATTASVPADNTEAWRTITIPAGTIPTSDEVQVDVVATAATGSTITVTDVLLTEAPFAEERFVISSGSRVESPAARAYQYAGPFDGAPIVADFAQTRTQDQFTDRASLLRSTYHLAARCSSTLIADRLGQEAGTAGGGKVGTQTLANTRLQTSPGMASADVWVLVRRIGNINPLNQPQIFAALDGIGQESALIELGAVPDQDTQARVWRYLGAVPLTEGATHEIAIRAIFSSALDEVALEGVAIFERPALFDSEQQYFYQRDDYSLAAPIPDSGSVSRSITAPTDNAFVVRRMRAYIKVTHPAPTQLEYALTDGSTTVNFRYPGTAGFADSWWSDSGAGGVIGDAPNEEDFSVFYNATSAKTWTLTVADTAGGSVGTLDAFALELW
jgi:hypothetical protein